MTTMRKCPMAKTAKSGACHGPECDHWTAKHARVCLCCLRRLGPNRATPAELARSMGALEKLKQLEDEILVDLHALGPSKPRHTWKKAAVP